MHERQQEGGRPLPWLFFNASTGKYYRRVHGTTGEVEGLAPERAELDRGTARSCSKPRDLLQLLSMQYAIVCYRL